MSGYSRKNKLIIEYPEIPSATKLILRSNLEKVLKYDENEGEPNSTEKSDANETRTPFNLRIDLYLFKD